MWSQLEELQSKLRNLIRKRTEKWEDHAQEMTLRKKERKIMSQRKGVSSGLCKRYSNTDFMRIPSIAIYLCKTST
jgi:hypothetical protein